MSTQEATLGIRHLTVVPTNFEPADEADRPRAEADAEERDDDGRPDG